MLRINPILLLMTNVTLTGFKEILKIKKFYQQLCIKENFILGTMQGLYRLFTNLQSFFTWGENVFEPLKISSGSISGKLLGLRQLFGNQIKCPYFGHYGIFSTQDKLIIITLNNRDCPSCHWARSSS